MDWTSYDAELDRIARRTRATGWIVLRHLQGDSYEIIGITTGRSYVVQIESDQYKLIPAEAILS